jgi:hypothetical protein
MTSVYQADRRDAGIKWQIVFLPDNSGFLQGALCSVPGDSGRKLMPSFFSTVLGISRFVVNPIKVSLPVYLAGFERFIQTAFRQYLTSWRLFQYSGSF